jgi:hypothetical protein
MHSPGRTSGNSPTFFNGNSPEGFPPLTAGSTSSNSIGDDDPQVLFRAAANAVAQLYRSTNSSAQKAYRRGYSVAIQDVTEGLRSLDSHPLSVHTNGRAFVPLDLVLHCVHATQVASETERGTLNSPNEANSCSTESNVIMGSSSEVEKSNRRLNFSQPPTAPSNSTSSLPHGAPWNSLEPNRKRARDF